MLYFEQLYLRFGDLVINFLLACNFGFGELMNLGSYVLL